MYRQKKKIPTILALVLLFTVMTGLVYFDTSRHSLTSQAETYATPVDINFTNITDKSFTISWLTSVKAVGMVKLLNGPNAEIYLDDLDTDNISRSRNTHHVTLKNLESNTIYSVTIVSGDEKCKKEENCITYTTGKTAISLDSSSLLPPARGTIVDASGKGVDQAVVYLTIGKSAPLSSRVDSSGLWVIPLNNLYSQDLLSRPQLEDDDLLQITAKIDPGTQASAVIDVKSIRQNLTVPTMVLGHSYNFIDLINKKEQLASLLKQNTLGIKTEKVSSPFSNFDILFPTKDSDFTTDPQPRIRGVAPANSQLTITINSAPQTAKITVASDGTWVFRPIKPLSPGTHTVIVEGFDDSGNPITLSRKFIVLKSGEAVLGEATPSASLTPTVSATNTPSPSPFSQITPTTPIISPTPTTAVPTTPPQITPPPSGGLQPAFFLFGGSMALMVLGLRLLIL